MLCVCVSFLKPIASPLPTCAALAPADLEGRPGAPFPLDVSVFGTKVRIWLVNICQVPRAALVWNSREAAFFPPSVWAQIRKRPT